MEVSPNEVLRVASCEETIMSALIGFGIVFFIVVLLILCVASLSTGEPPRSFTQSPPLSTFDGVAMMKMRH